MQTNVEVVFRQYSQLLGYQDAFKNIESKQLKGEGATLAGWWFLSNRHFRAYNMLKCKMF